MQIWCDEILIELEEGASLTDLRAQQKPEADCFVLNGSPAKGDELLHEGDHVVLITRGAIPAPEELEALMMARHSPGVHQAVKSATIGIAGCGGLGSPVAFALARTGVGRIIIADYDVVEASNLNRQQFFIDQIGMLKVEALQQNLRRINPYVEVIPHALRLDKETIATCFAGVDVMIEAFDEAEAKAMLIEAFGAAFPETPLIIASGVAGYESSNTIRSRRLGKKMILVGDEATGIEAGNGLMAPRVGIAAHHQANAALRILLGEEEL